MQQCSQFPLQRAMMSDKTPRSFQNVHWLAAWEYTALFKVETFIAKHHMQTKIKKKKQCKHQIRVKCLILGTGIQILPTTTIHRVKLNIFQESKVTQQIFELIVS